MSLSIPEVILADLTALMQTIQTPDYRNTIKSVSQIIKDPAQVTEFPSIVILLNDGWIETNEAMTVFKEFVDVSIIGYVSADPDSAQDVESSLVANAESLLHDMRRAISSIMLGHVADSQNRYKVYRRNPAVRFLRLLPGAGVTKGVVGMQFSMWIIAQDSTFSL